MKSLQRLLHAVLVIVGALPWLLGCIAFGVACLLMLWANRVWPDADRGNCWSYAAPRFVKGGYLVVRPAGDVRIFGLPVMHAIWMPSIPDGAVLEQTVPVRRARSRVFNPALLYFPFRIRTTETNPRPPAA